MPDSEGNYDHPLIRFIKRARGQSGGELAQTAIEAGDSMVRPGEIGLPVEEKIEVHEVANDFDADKKPEDN